MGGGCVSARGLRVHGPAPCLGPLTADLTPSRPAVAPAHWRLRRRRRGSLWLRPPGAACKRLSKALPHSPAAPGRQQVEKCSCGRMNAGSDPVVIVSAARTAVGKWAVAAQPGGPRNPWDPLHPDTPRLPGPLGRQPLPAPLRLL